MIHPQEVTKEQLLAAIKSLEERPADRVRILGDLGITAAGVGVGAAAAGTIAGIAGVTSIPVLTTAASWLGASVSLATPVGWVVGAAAATGLAAYGLSRLVRSGGLADGKIQELQVHFRDQLKRVEELERSGSITANDRTQFIKSLRELIEKDAIPPSRAFSLIEVVEKGQMPLSEACKLVSELLSEIGSKKSN
jgi:hypothetical protein